MQCRTESKLVRELRIPSKPARTSWRSALVTISREMPPKPRRQRRKDDERSCFRRQLATIKQGLRDSNTGRFAKRSAYIRLPPYEQYAKMYRTVRLQNLTRPDAATEGYTYCFGGSSSHSPCSHPRTYFLTDACFSIHVRCSWIVFKHVSLIIFIVCKHVYFQFCIPSSCSSFTGF